MSKLNPSAYSFVPGQRLTLPQQAIERPEQTEPPPPAPTITLNIGNKQVPPPAPTISGPTPSKKAEENPKSTAIKITKGDVSAKTFTTEKAKSDTNAVAQEVKNAADRAVLEDLFGSCLF